MTSSRPQLPEIFDELELTAEHFHVFYHTFMGLRFPLAVAEVLDLRYLINHAVDGFTEPPLTPDYRQFRESLEKALDSFAIEDPRRRERLLKILTMLREQHLVHTLASRDAEEQLRMAMEDNQLAHQRAVRRGLFYVFASVASVMSWFILPDQWLVKIVTVLCAIESWNNFHRLPKLDRQALGLRQQLNDLLRQRIDSLNWKTLIHKLALVLGFKQIKGVDVFRVDASQDITTPYH